MSTQRNPFKHLFKQIAARKYILLAVAALIVAGSIFHINTRAAHRSQTEPVKNSSPIIEVESASENGKPKSTQKSAASQQCSQVVIPYGTVEQQAIWLYKGQTQIYSRGINGKKEICTDSTGKQTERVTSKAFDEVKYVGTKKNTQPAEPESPSYSYDQALQLAKEACKGYAPDSTDLSDCKTKEMRKYGY